MGVIEMVISENALFFITFNIELLYPGINFFVVMSQTYDL